MRQRLILAWDLGWPVVALGIALGVIFGVPTYIGYKIGHVNGWREGREDTLKLVKRCGGMDDGDVARCIEGTCVPRGTPNQPDAVPLPRLPIYRPGERPTSSVPGAATRPARTSTRSPAPRRRTGRGSSARAGVWSSRSAS